MVRQKSHSMGGAREGAGRKSVIPIGDGEIKAVNLRVGDDLLEKLRQRWPDLTDSDRIRAAIWEAVGEPKV